MQTIAHNDKAAYQNIIGCFKKYSAGLTVADLSAKTALPLEKVRELLPVCADEFSARLRVTESGEILYSFPGGFSSKYRGVRAVLTRFLEKAGGILKIAAMNLFKVWILVMLIGYFVLFVLLALAAIVLSVVAQNSSKDRDGHSQNSGGGVFVSMHLIDFIIRIWFYSELTKSFDGSRRQRAKLPRRPLYKAVFSFVFGDGDLNAGIVSRERQAALAYIQAAGGVISLPEFMILTGKSPAEAEDAITSFCAAYGGSPEATEDGTVVYRFDALLLHTEKTPARRRAYQGPLHALNIFSSNEKKFNVWFSILNGVNLLFGGYFTINALNTGAISDYGAAAQEAYFYTLVYHLVENGLQTAALPVLLWGLGMVPLVFSLLFWLIPLVRAGLLKQKNEAAKYANLRQFVFDAIWKQPQNVTAEALVPADAASRPRALAAAQNGIINELAAYSPVEVEAAEPGTFVYSFNELEHEKNALSHYRTAQSAPQLGEIVFDSAAGA